VVINPLQNNSFYSGTNTDFRTRYLDEQLVRDLGGQYASGLSAKFYTEAEARRINLIPDWAVDISLDNMLQQPNTSRQTRNLSRQIQIDSDTSGKPVYQTVRATLYITRQQYSSGGNIEFRITDLQTKENIAWDRTSLNRDRTYETATYTGDSRALGPDDWTMVNNNNMPERSQISDEAYSRFLNDLKSRMRNLIN
jgi:hypothetical protein